MNRTDARLAGPSWIGVNYWSASGGPLMWRHYDGPLVSKELAQLADLGIKVTRSFLYWPDLMPTPDALDESVLARVEDFVQRHADAGMSTIVTFLVGHMSGENWDPAWRGGRDLFSDVWFVARQAWYVREVTARLAHHSAVCGWLLTNEMPIYGDERGAGIGTLDADAVTAWAQILIDAVRLGGGTQPVSVGDGAWGIETTGADNGFRVDELAPLMDFLGPHSYRMETDLVRRNIGAGFTCELLGSAGLPIVLEEFGVTDDFVGEVDAADYYRQVLHTSLLAGSTGWIAWNNVDYDDLYEQDPYRHHPFELHFGLIRSDGTTKPQGEEVKAFARLLERVDIEHCQRVGTETAIVVSSFLDGEHPFTVPEDATVVVDTLRQSYLAAREADLAPVLVRERGGLPEDASLLIVPSAKQLLAPTWHALLDRAHAGATVFASYFSGDHLAQRGSWWPDIDGIFGVRKRLHYGLTHPIEDDEVTITIEVPFGGLESGATLTFPTRVTSIGAALLPVEPDGAQVLARDHAGRPFLLRRTHGSGAMILCTYPLEFLAAMQPAVNPEPTWQLYDALAREAGVLRPVHVPDPRVMVDEMRHTDGRVFTWFVSQATEPVALAPIAPGSTFRTLDGGAWAPSELAPLDVLVLERVAATERPAREVKA